MDSAREKLIDVFMHLDRHIQNRDEYGICYTSDFAEAVETVLAMLKNQDANGVTVQKWIAVTERLPDTIPCGAGTAYSEAVNVLTSGRKVLTAIWNGLYWICDAEFWDAEFEEITHWTPVLLPLPKPPKGE